MSPRPSRIKPGLVGVWVVLAQGPSTSGLGTMGPGLDLYQYLDLCHTGLSSRLSHMPYVSFKDFEADICFAACHLSLSSCLLCSLFSQSFFCFTVILRILCWLLLYLVWNDARPPRPVHPHTPLRTAIHIWKLRCTIQFQVQALHLILYV
jgi:hypothetical protein